MTELIEGFRTVVWLMSGWGGGHGGIPFSKKKLRAMGDESSFSCFSNLKVKTTHTHNIIYEAVVSIF